MSFSSAMKRGWDDDDELDPEFKKKMAEEFKKAFPLPSDRKKPTTSASVSQPKTPRQRTLKPTVLNFDDSLCMPNNPLSLNIQLTESKQELAMVKRKLQQAMHDIDTFKQKEKVGVEKYQQLKSENAELKEQVVQAGIDMDRSMNDSAVTGTLVQRSVEEARDVANVFYKRFQMAEQQLKMAKEILSEEGLWNSAVRRRLYESYHQKEPESIPEGEYESLACESVFAYVGVDGYDGGVGEEEEGRAEREEAEMRERRRSREGQIREKTQSLFAQTSERLGEDMDISHNGTADSDMLNSALNISSVSSASTAYERDQTEEIQRLQIANHELKNKLIVFSERASRTLVLEETKRDLEDKNVMLQGMLDDSIAKTEQYRSAMARSGGCESSAEFAANKRLADKVAQLGARCDELQSQLAATQRQMEAERETSKQSREKLEMDVETLTHERDQMRNRLDSIEEDFDEMESQFTKTMNEKKALEAEQTVKEQEMEKIRGELERTMAQVAESSKPPATDAGDTTQIFHMASNPLEMAHKEMLEEEERSRKRKLSGMDESLSNESKRLKDEQISALESKLQRSEKEKERAVSIQMELAKKYREITTMLIGYQIKMKEQGVCHVTNCADPEEREFIFSYDSEEGVVNLLQNSMLDETGVNPWEEEMSKYIGEYGSIPAFLSAVTLRLISQNASASQPPQFSVLHED